MRTLMKVVMPVEPGNRAINDGTLPSTVQALIEENKPEAAYFYAENGKRTMLFVLDMKDSAQIPELAEPLFMRLNAEVQFFPVMNAADLKSGLDKFSARKHGRTTTKV
ncbi:MAG: hypothetical protein Q8T11_07555 [Elusimicrobiota bacterium]|nr:hypothetical protein [Elusimicrobiota bacterium]